MIKDFLISFRDNFQEKTTNPFLGTYLLVWLIRNWELVYTLFNFDKDTKLLDKVSYIKSYYSQVSFFENILTNILWAFALLITTYILLNVSRLIVNLSEKRVAPWVYKITDSKSIILKVHYERIRSARDDLQSRLDMERESKAKLENRIKELEEEIISVRSKNSQHLAENETQNLPNEIDIIIDKLNKDKIVKHFIEAAASINAGYGLPRDYPNLMNFIKLGLIRSTGVDFKLTADGEAILKRIRFAE